MTLRTKLAIQISMGLLFGLALLTLGAGLAAENVGRGVNYPYKVTLSALTSE